MNFITKHIRRKKELLFACKDRKAVYMPAEKLSSAIVIGDAGTPESENMLSLVRKWAADYGVTAYSVYFSLKARRGRDKNGDAAKGDIVLFRNDIRLAGIPKNDFLKEILGKRYDLLICTASPLHYPVEFVVKCCNASFKAGIDKSRIDLFDMLVTGDKSGSEKIEFMLDSITKIKGED